MAWSRAIITDDETLAALVSGWHALAVKRRGSSDQGHGEPIFSERHRELIQTLVERFDLTWGEQALQGCLEKLRDGGPTEWRIVEVHDAWAFEDGFCVVYTSPWGPKVGIRVTRGTSDGPPLYIAGLYAEAFVGGPSTPEQFGWEVADFAIGVPLGSCADHLVDDKDGLGWWGDVPLPGTRSSN